MLYNPCDQCVVNPMCRQACDKFERIVYGIMNPNGEFPNRTYFKLSEDILNRKLIIVDGEIVQTNEDLEND